MTMSEEAPSRLERYRRRYAELTSGWMPATAQFQYWVAARTDSGTRVLDLGCGRGGIVERLGRWGHWTGSDPDFVSLRQHRWSELRRCCATAEHLPFQAGSFDLVVSSWVLEHLANPMVSFQEISRILRPGGSFVFLTPNASHPLPWLSRKLASLQKLQRSLVPVVYNRRAGDTFPVAYEANTHQEIEQLASATGLRLARLAWVVDPSYLAWNEPTFWIAVAFSTLLPSTWKVHLIGVLTKP
jgi:SAM-dependent methyltransferase